MTSAYIPVADLPLVQELIASYNKIVIDAKKLFETEAYQPKMRTTVIGGRNISRKGMSSYYGQARAVSWHVDERTLDPAEHLICFGNTPEQKQTKLDLYKLRRSYCPTIDKLLIDYKDVLMSTSTFALWPGAQITPHYGVNNEYVRIHLCLQENPGCRFFTEHDEPRTWYQRQVFGFLDYEVLHWVIFDDEPEANQERIILNVDVEKSYYTHFYPGVLDARLEQLDRVKNLPL